MFPASIDSVLHLPLAPPEWAMTKTGGQDPHLDCFIGRLARVRSGDPRVHKPPKLLPPVVIFIEVGVVMRHRDELHGRRHARTLWRSWHRRGRYGALPPILDRSQYALSVGHGRWESTGLESKRDLIYGTAWRNSQNCKPGLMHVAGIRSQPSRRGSMIG